jgi:hypothetical protein
MMRAPAFLSLGRFVKRVFHRCKEDGCWKKGMSCSEMDTGDFTSYEQIMRTRQTFYWQCHEHAMVETNAHGPRVVSVGARVRVLECMDPQQCYKHSNHEGSYQNIIEGEGDPIQGPLAVVGFVVKTDDGVVYQAKRIEFIE